MNQNNNDPYYYIKIANIYNNRNRKHPLKTIYYYENEVFRESSYYPGYIIGNHGTIYDINRRVKLKPLLSQFGYPLVALRRLDGTYYNAFVHQMIMMAFDPKPEYKTSSRKIEINHIDGNKKNCYYCPGDPKNNLEWCTHKENMSHALRIGLLKTGEDSVKSIYTNGQIRTICSILNNGGSDEEALIGAGLEINDHTITLLYSIKSRTRWNQISKDYPNIPYPKERIEHTEEEVKLICEYLSKGLSDQKVSEIMINNHGFKNATTRFVGNVRLGRVKSFKYITNNYTFDKKLYRYQFSDEEIHKICQYMVDGYSYTQIIEKMGIKDDNCIRSFPTLLFNLKNNKLEKYKHITSQYKFNDVKRPSNSTDEDLINKIIILENQGMEIEDIANKLNMTIFEVNMVKRGIKYIRKSKYANVPKQTIYIELEKEGK